MLEITAKIDSINKHTIKHYSWHVGEPNPINYEEVNNVTEIQADGDELDYIVDDLFMGNRGIPVPRRRVVRWFGDHAKLIVGNLT